jgi:hypothetical protein
VALKKSKKAVQKYDRSCPSCGQIFNVPTDVHLPASNQIMIEHFKRKHADRMALCFDSYGSTWLEQYDVVMKAFHHNRQKLEEAVAQRDQAAGQQRTLAAKLNAIIMILENKA